MATLLRPRQISKNEEELGGQMSFLDHLDELRRRLIRSVLFVFLAMTVCWFFSDRIYSFLAVPVERALAEAQRRQLPIAGLTGNEAILGLGSLKENDIGRYVFPEETKLGTSVIPPGASVTARVARNSNGQLGFLLMNRSTPETQLSRKACVYRSTSMRFRKRHPALMISSS